MLLFGVMEVDEVNALIFLPEQQANENAKAYDAVAQAATWGEFRELCPASLLEEIEDALRENQLEYCDYEEFVCCDIPGYDDAIWPAFPAHDQFAWFPDILRERFGNTISTPQGNVLQLPAIHQEQIVRGLIGEGFRCLRDDAIVRRACGH